MCESKKKNSALFNLFSPLFLPSDPFHSSSFLSLLFSMFFFCFFLYIEKRCGKSEHFCGKLEWGQVCEFLPISLPCAVFFFVLPPFHFHFRSLSNANLIKSSVQVQHTRRCIINSLNAVKNRSCRSNKSHTNRPQMLVVIVIYWIICCSAINKLNWRLLSE